MRSQSPNGQVLPSLNDEGSKRILVIGAGMSGMLMAIQLLQSGRSNFVVYEKAGQVGGTWRDNIYPGLKCDVPAAMFSYSFSPNQEYSSRFPMGSEIQAYLLSIADRYHLSDFIRYNTTVESVCFEDGFWHVQTNDGLIEKLHHLTLALLRAPDAEVTLDVIHESMRSDFAIPSSAVRWWGGQLADTGLEAATACSVEFRDYIAGLDRPYVGPNAAHESRDWLGDAAIESRSFAYVPLADGAVSGVLMLASGDGGRFTPDMATDVLTRLAHLTSAALARFATRSFEPRFA